MCDVLMISSVAGESGIGDYVEDLTSHFSTTDVECLDIPINSNNPLNFARIATQPAAMNPDVIHVQHEYGQFGTISLMSWIFFPILYVVATLKRIPVVVTMHEGLNEQLVTKPLRYPKQLYIRLLNAVVTVGADRVIFLSKQTADELRQSVDPGQSVVLHHGVSTQKYVDISKREAKRRLGYDTDSVLISEPGFIEPRKGSEQLVELSERLPEYEFVLGGGASRPSYQEYVDRIEKRAPNNLTVTKRLDKERFHMLFVASDLIVLPYVEANQAGVLNTTNQSGILNRCATYLKPVLTSNQSYFRTIDREWNSVVTCDFDEVDRVEKLVRELINDSKMREELSEAMAAFADEHSFSQVAERHERIYKELSAQ